MSSVINVFCYFLLFCYVYQIIMYFCSAGGVPKGASRSDF